MTRMSVHGAMLGCALVALAAGCSEEEGGANGSSSSIEGGGADGGGGSEGGAAGADTEDIDLTLVSVLEIDTSNPIAAPHRILFLNSLTGEPFEGFEDGLMSEAETGRVLIEDAPRGTPHDLYVIGNPDAADPTYDTVSVNVPDDTGETLLRVSLVGLKATAEQTGGFTPQQDRAAAAGAIYWTPGGPGNMRMGTVGCAQVFMDDDLSGVNDEISQRYVGDSGLPVGLHLQDKTDASGRFYFGNLTVGEHTLRISLDGGETFIAEQTFRVDRSHEMAIGEEKTILYLLGVDVDADVNPGPESCEGIY